MANFEMLDHVVDVIQAHPEQHDQKDWARKSACGTKMCFAGWTVHEAGAKLLFEDGLSWTSRCVDKDGIEQDISMYASELLDLTEQQENELFYDVDSDINGIKMTIKRWANEA